MKTCDEAKTINIIGRMRKKDSLLITTTMKVKKSFSLEDYSHDDNDDDLNSFHVLTKCL